MQNIQNPIMDLAALPADTTLYKLLATCSRGHEIVVTECADGALLFDCFECPIHHILDTREEGYVRTEEARMQSEVVGEPTPGENLS